MLELIALGVAGAAGFGGHRTSKSFVRRRLRFTNLVEKPGLGLAAGVGAALLATPVVAVLPVVGLGTAIAVGVGVGSGVAVGARQAREGYVPDD